MNASLYFNLAKQLLERNNPLVEVLNRIYMMVQMVLTYQSNVKLNKYRHSLYVQQLKRMEGFLSQSSPYQYRGEKINRIY